MSESPRSSGSARGLVRLSWGTGGTEGQSPGTALGVPGPAQQHLLRPGNSAATTKLCQRVNVLLGEELQELQPRIWISDASRVCHLI